MGFRYRERFLTEKCINTLVHDYLQEKDNYHSAPQDLKIAFCEFLSQNETQYVRYGIDYLQQLYPEVAEILKPLIWEYRTHGVTGGLTWDPIPQKEATYVEEKHYEIDTDDCTFKEKIVLFVMKLLKLGEK